jgi:hypothetical protein
MVGVDEGKILLVGKDDRKRQNKGMQIWRLLVGVLVPCLVKG